LFEVPCLLGFIEVVENYFSLLLTFGTQCALVKSGQLDAVNQDPAANPSPSVVCHYA
jgi:hypothetical protein